MDDKLFLESLIKQTALTPKQSVVGEKINEARDPHSYTMNWNDVDDQIDSGSSDVDAGITPNNYERGEFNPYTLSRAQKALWDGGDFDPASTSYLKTKVKPVRYIPRRPQKDEVVKLKQAYEKLSQQRQDLLDQVKEVEVSMQRIVQMSSG